MTTNVLTLVAFAPGMVVCTMVIIIMHWYCSPGITPDIICLQVTVSLVPTCTCCSDMHTQLKFVGERTWLYVPKTTWHECPDGIEHMPCWATPTHGLELVAHLPQISNW